MKNWSQTSWSLALAILSSISLYFFAKSPLFYGDTQAMSSKLLFGITLGFSVIGIITGMRGYRAKKDIFALLAPIVNALLSAAVVGFFSLLMQAS